MSSSFDPVPSDRLEVTSEVGAALTDFDYRVMASLLKSTHALRLPKDTLSYLVEYLALNQPMVPISQVIGYGFLQQTVLVGKTAAQTITTATPTTLTWDNEYYDLPDDGMHSNSVNPSRLTVTAAGRYLPTAFVRWIASVAGTYRQVMLFKNGVGGNESSLVIPTAGGYVTEHLLTFAAQNLVVGDYLEVKVEHDVGLDLDVHAGSQFGLTRIA